MPDPSSPEGDSFSNLFEKLPDPRSRNAAPSASSDTGNDDAATPAPPLSRRAARGASAGPALSAHGAAPAASAAPDSSAVSAASSASAAETTRAAEPMRAGAPTATIDELFSDNAHQTHDVPAPVKRRRRGMGCLIALIIVAAVVGGIAAGGLWVWNTYESQIREVMGWQEPRDFEAGMANGEALVTVVSGDTGASISETLFEAGVTKTSGAFYTYLIDTAQSPPFVPGVFALQKQMTSEAALAALIDPANKREFSVLMPEGSTVKQTLEAIAVSLSIPPEEVTAAAADPAAFGVAASSLEGWLFPAYYTFDPGVTVTQVIQTMVDRTVQSLDTAGVPEAEREEILIIASIIQREARFEADFYKVSRVIQNRLGPTNTETYGLLQMDSTAQYGFNEIDDGTVSTSEEAQFNDNPWNTYVHPGLPIGPIANPGDVAIDAAMHPVDGPWFYFVTVNLDTGETVFTNTLAEHDRARVQWDEWCQANPDSGC